MKRTPFAVAHSVSNLILWYGSEYEFNRPDTNEYEEPTEQEHIVEVLQGVYHASQRSFLDLLNTEGVSVKSKTNVGVLTVVSSGNNIQQGDKVAIHSSLYKVTAVEPVLYGGVKIATEISLEEVLFNEA